MPGDLDLRRQILGELREYASHEMANDLKSRYRPAPKTTPAAVPAAPTEVPAETDPLEGLGDEDLAALLGGE